MSDPYGSPQGPCHQWPHWGGRGHRPCSHVWSRVPPQFVPTWRLMLRQAGRASFPARGALGRAVSRCRGPRNGDGDPRGCYYHHFSCISTHGCSQLSPFCHLLWSQPSEAAAVSVFPTSPVPHLVRCRPACSSRTPGGAELGRKISARKPEKRGETGEKDAQEPVPGAGVQAALGAEGGKHGRGCSQQRVREHREETVRA